MNKKAIVLWAAVIAVLFLLLGLSIWHFYGECIISLDTKEQAILARGASSTAAPRNNTESPSSEPTAETESTPDLSEIPGSSNASTSKPQPTQFCTLTILGKQIKVMNNVDEATLEKTPGWLPSSALPGEDGMCVIYGHRNRRHLRVLENIKTSDEITVTMTDGTVLTYSVIDTKIYKSTSVMTLPMADDKTLVLVTCYPFRYSGHAPGKFLIIAGLE